ncbi:MAG: hypothetical protein WA137_01910 [Methanothrix sp.]
MKTKNTQDNINVESFLNDINAYVFNFLNRSITGKLVEKIGDYIVVEMRSGSVIVARLDSLKSIWRIGMRKETLRSKMSAKK